ncbi:MAG: ATP-binding protein [Clostridia bacterium]|nr:ATP-binding protein [Clostridia bacterium]
MKEKIQKSKILEILQGEFKKENEIYPTYINLNNPKYIEMEDKYFSTILVVNYYREQNDLLLKNLIDTNINMNISMFYEKKDSYKMIRELTYHIGNTGVDLENKNQNSQDIELVAYTHNDAKYIRKEMQVNNQELYFLYLYITVFAKDIRELEYLLNKVEGMIQSKGMQSRRAYFRQEQAFISSLPLMQNHEDVKQVTKRNILTNGLISTYPFISSSIFDENGIYIGNNIYNHSLVFVDRYNTEKYKNANISIFGTSGAGKSFYTKLLILRNALLGINQYIIDPEREYENVCKNLGGTLIKIGPTSSTYINIFDIRKESIEEEEKGYLAAKIGKLIGFFNLVFGQMDEEEKAILEEKIIECYAKKGITFDDKTLYKEDENKITITKIFKTSKDMPILEDLYHILEQDPKTKTLKTKLIPFVKGSLRFFNEYTNIEIDQKLIVADIYEVRRR